MTIFGNLFNNTPAATTTTFTGVIRKDDQVKAWEGSWDVKPAAAPLGVVVSYVVNMAGANTHNSECCNLPNSEAWNSMGAALVERNARTDAAYMEAAKAKAEAEEAEKLLHALKSTKEVFEKSKASWEESQERCQAAGQQFQELLADW